MPVTFKLVPHLAKSLDLRELTAEKELSSVAYTEYTKSAKNGIANAFLTAYNTHHALVLRPDDIWLAIAVQFSFYVNKHAEELRGRFVAHEGTEEIDLSFNPYEMMDNGGALATFFANELVKRVTDTQLRAWLVPDFSTTTETDRIVGCAVFMGAMKKYFTYTGGCGCGIPRVTLEGTREDWEQIIVRADRLREYGNECVQWHRLLMPVLRGFVSTFDDPELKNESTRAFWERAVQYGYQMSGVTNIAGWMSAFYPFDDEGNCVKKSQERGVSINGVDYPVIEIGDIPACFTTCGYQAVRRLDDVGCATGRGCRQLRRIVERRHKPL
ncbi:hypothetical protein BKA62DRAFT_827027 [Auriculariales sp. MPI-PUGE-AT-0066]|nr:hypothetical protein BKA62DRAFT_827027 [Auriculariales sp. MPI-PUGE-AT-0066]